MKLAIYLSALAAVTLGPAIVLAEPKSKTVAPWHIPIQSRKVPRDGGGEHGGGGPPVKPKNIALTDWIMFQDLQVSH